MRLTSQQQNAITVTARQFFKNDVQVKLFGSRTRDDALGGDIDLLIKTTLTEPDEIVKSHIGFLTGVKRLIGEQKIDVLIDYPNMELRPLIFEVAENDGILL